MTPARWRSPLLRLALAQAAAFLLTFLALGSAGYYTLKNISEATMQRSVERDLADLRDWYAEDGLYGLEGALEDRTANTYRDAFYVLHTPRKEKRVPSDTDVPAALLAKRGWHDFRLSTPEGQRPALAYVEFFPDGSRLLVGHIAWERETLYTAMKQELGIGLLLVLLLAMLLAGLTSRAIAHALAAPLAVARRFAGGELDARVTPNASGDSFDRLAQALNAMFTRIQDLVGGIAHATDAIAHDLRTPLTRLKTQLETARLASRDSPATQAPVEAALSEADQLLATFQAMMRLARVEADTRQPVTPVDMAALVQDAVELFEALADNQQQALEAHTESLMVPGDRDQLFQLLVNLLDNAIKYAPSGARINVTLTPQGNHARLCISDDGPGIPAAERQRVFDRFVRLESHRGSPGNGLGLSLVRAITRHHSGRIYLEDANPGLRVVILLPLHLAEPLSPAEESHLNKP